MKKHRILKGDSGRRHVVVGHPVSASSISFDDLFEDISDHWLEKARRLQARRWRKIKHQTI